ncbi:glycoside hydrolase family 99-like domain-containing protein [uncultured Mailhella sp.]|uniref:glycoside hydrolase family 99-like domain-containing protein n=1 Tax=uncultured Mailhella sp. TaxID=1981031 RepID=UPI002625CD3F|nr:glycoside hydrolase family 99-like domain-containing protein [uncultured Mailhella sp.]
MKILKYSRKDGVIRINICGLNVFKRKHEFRLYKYYILGIKIFQRKIHTCKTKHQESLDYMSYIKFLENLKFYQKKDFVPICDIPYVRHTNDTKIIAYYLPQYYQIDINDHFHGKGFTEWTQATQAMPLFTGHEQPQLPYDLGFYNLLNPDTLKRQAELAGRYGIYGFCMHWYWFSGQRIMEKPIDILFEHPEIDIHYCFNWANENWTKCWDGGNNELIFQQTLKSSEAPAFFHDMSKYFKDPRYIRIDGKPLLSIYKVSRFEEKEMYLFIQKLRECAEISGLKGLYITVTTAGDCRGDFEKYGADALNEFMPYCINRIPFYPSGYVNSQFKGYIADYKKNIDNKDYMINYHTNNYYRSAMVNFDNSSRKAYKKDCIIYHGTNSYLFKIWLKDILIESKRIHDMNTDFIFINNWNEWAEGSHLEPDLRHGYANLQAVKEALEMVRGVNSKIIEDKLDSIDESIIVTFYIHCIESFGDIVACEPIARYLKERGKSCKIYWIIKKEYEQIVKYNPNIDSLIFVKCLHESIDLCQKIKDKPNTILIDCHYDNRKCVETGIYHTNFNNPVVNESTYYDYGSLLQAFCLSAGLPALDIAPVFWEKKNIKNPYSLPSKYITLHCKAAEKSRNWTDKKWNNIARYIINKKIYIVEIGIKKTIHLGSPFYIDLTGERDFQELAVVIKNTSVFCSVDSGFAHIANCYNIPSCIILGKYKNFDRPMPYTGFYKANPDNLFYAEHALPASTVEENIIIKNILLKYKKTK